MESISRLHIHAYYFVTHICFNEHKTKLHGFYHFPWSRQPHGGTPRRYIDGHLFLGLLGMLCRDEEHIHGQLQIEYQNSPCTRLLSSDSFWDGFINHKGSGHECVFQEIANHAELYKVFGVFLIRTIRKRTRFDAVAWELVIGLTNVTSPDCVEFLVRRSICSVLMIDGYAKSAVTSSRPLLIWQASQRTL
jgi:hypothetical protein